MSIEKNKAIVRKFEEELWKGNFAIFDELTSPDMSGVSRDGTKAWITEMRQMPDLTFSISDMVAEEDKVWFRWNLQGTHTAPVSTPWGAVKPTGKAFTGGGVSMFVFRDDKIVDDQVVADAFTYFLQLGVISLPEQSS